MTARRLADLLPHLLLPPPEAVIRTGKEYVRGLEGTR